MNFSEVGTTNTLSVTHLQTFSLQNRLCVPPYVDEIIIYVLSFDLCFLSHSIAGNLSLAVHVA